MKQFAKGVTATAVVLCVVFLLCANAFAGNITKQQAVNKALADAGLKKSQITELEAEKEKNSYEIEFIRTKTGDRYEYEISAGSGLVKESEIDYSHKQNFSRDKVGKTAAIAAAAKKTGVKASVVKQGTVKLKTDDGELVYKIKFKKGNCKYECEILAPTGKVIELSKEYIRK